MNIWFFIQLSVNIALGGALFLLWSKFRKPPAEDPRLSKGLQLLQSKIAILEDLSDRTEVLVKQLNTLMDSKMREIHHKIEQANVQIHAVEKSISKSRDVAKLFQEKIPHEEIIERKTTMKYIEAARMAHQGATREEIAEKLDIPAGEVELIVQMNQGELLFGEETIPEWARTEQTAAPEVEQEYQTQTAPEPEDEQQAFERLQAQFQRAQVVVFDEPLPPVPQPSRHETAQAFATHLAAPKVPAPYAAAASAAMRTPVANPSSAHPTPAPRATAKFEAKQPASKPTEENRAPRVFGRLSQGRSVGEHVQVRRFEFKKIESPE